MENIPTCMLIVAGALRRDNDHWLMQKRPPGKPHAGLWEFPGGKVEGGELPADALVRELKEELTIDVNQADCTPLSFASDSSAVGAAGHRSMIVILLYNVERWTGDPFPCEGGTLRWVTPTQALALDTLPLDRQMLRAMFE